MVQDAVQVTPAFAVSPVTFAAIRAVPLTGKGVALGGITLTEIPGTLKLADTGIEPPAADVAVIVTVKSPAGGMAEAV